MTYNLNYLVSANEILYESRYGNSLFEQNKFYRKTFANRDNRNRNNMNSNNRQRQRYTNDKKKSMYNTQTTNNSNRWQESTYY